MGRKRALVVCGPTASGKSAVADELAVSVADFVASTGPGADLVPTLVVDSMQVYRELPVISNQARGRAAELVGMVSVTEEWTVARHRDAALRIISGVDGPFVLDAGTGMYLNAILLDIPLAPRVPDAVRDAARRAASGAPNPRRATREAELKISGAPERGSIWGGYPRYETAILYLRPDRAVLDAAIAERSARIVETGTDEAKRLRDMLQDGLPVSASVLDSIGVRELLLTLDGEITQDQAQERMATRTRRLARRQMRWFDKLARTLRGRTFTTVVASPPEIDIHYMHDILRA